MYKLIASDLDETLLDSNSHVSKRNIDAIKKAKALGVKFVPATGRGFDSIQGTLKELGLVDQAEEYTISFNGAAVTENYQNRLMELTTMPFDYISELFKFGLDYDVCIHIYTMDDLFVYFGDPEEIKYISGKMPIVEAHVANIDFLKEAQIVKILFQNMDRTYLQTVEAALPTDLKDKIEVSYSANRYIEFNLANTNKGNALLDLAKMLGIKPEETIAIGDNMNDYSMISKAGLGVAVQNAVPEIKELADYVCESDHQNHAIAELIEKFILN